MSDEKSKSLDVLGIKPISDSINTVVKTGLDFLEVICRPAAEEFGLLLQDRVRYWRAKNSSNILIKAKRNIDIQNNNVDLRASPRIVYNILENGSWIDDDKIQEMWAGLLASACTKDGRDESNLIFIDLLSHLTYSEVRILNYICENAKKKLTKNGLIFSEELLICLDDLQKISGIDDVHQLDRELDHMGSLNLIGGGFSVSSEGFDADIQPTPLALNMYVRCKGHSQIPVQYFNLTK